MLVVLVCKEGLLCTLTPLSFLPILTYFPYLHNHEYFALDRVLLVSVGVCVRATHQTPTSYHILLYTLSFGLGDTFKFSVGWEGVLMCFMS